MLLVVHNNRAYHAEVMIVQRMGERGRGVGARRPHRQRRSPIPTSTTRRWQRRTACHSEGPIDNPNDLAAAYQRALAQVRAGEPALIDVVSQPR